MLLLNTNIDELIESYAFNDPALEKYFKPIGDQLWRNILQYGHPDNKYGLLVSEHLKRTSKIGQKFLTAELGFSEQAGWNFYYANLLHDLGKAHPSFVPQIWQTPHRPTSEERLEKRAHTRLGVELLDIALVKTPEEIQTHPHVIITKALQMYHHERMDSQGYEAKNADKLGTIIKAICIIDAFDGDMVRRAHQPAKRTPTGALERMKTGKKYRGAFDLEMLERFIDFQHIAR